MDSDTRHHNLRAIVTRRGFRRLLGVRLITQVADGLFQAGLAGSVLFNPQRAASPMAIAAGFAVLLLPYSLIGPYVGVLLDRWSRRTVISVGNLIRAGLVVPAVALVWRGAEGPAFLCLILVIIGLSRLFLAAISAATPHVVEDDRLVTANALASTLGSLGYSLGLGGVALFVRFGLPASFHGYATVAALAPFGYVAAAALARRSFAARELGPDIPGGGHTSLAQAIAEVGHGTVTGVRHLVSRRVAAYALVAQSAHRTLYGVLALAILLICRDKISDTGDLKAAISGLGGAFVAAALGTLLASFVTPAISRRFGGWRWVGVLLGVAGPTVAVFGLPFMSAFLPLAIGWISLASQGTKIVVDTALQHECDDEYRGRVFSVNDTLFNVCFVLGTYLGALTLPVGGRSTAVLLAIPLGYAALTTWYVEVSARHSRRDARFELAAVLVGAPGESGAPRVGARSTAFRPASVTPRSGSLPSGTPRYTP